jgi:hypothetical protein
MVAVLAVGAVGGFGSLRSLMQSWWFLKGVVECLFIGEGFSVSSLIGEYEF